MRTGLADAGGQDIGHHVVITPVYAQQSDEIVGLSQEHDSLRTQGVRCSGFIRLASGFWPNGAIVWTVEGDGPLTLSPSIQCPQCGHHGWIREGKWVPA